MPALRRTLRVSTALLLVALLLPAATAALGQPKSAPPAPAAAPPSDDEVATTREQVIALLRMSPTLTQVIETDPSILSDQTYVSRENPQFAQYLTAHPEVVRNPDFYLFSRLRGPRGRNDPLHRLDGNDYNNNNTDPPTDAQVHRQMMVTITPFLVFISIFGVFIWLIRILLENRRWTRVFRLQSEIHAKLIDRFATNQELLHYMETEPGKRFLEAAPIPVAVDRNEPLPGGIARVVTPLQIGIVLTLLGIGLISLQHRIPDVADALLVFGMVALMPGLGFIISSLVTWRISTRLGLMPQAPAQSPDRQ